MSETTEYIVKDGQRWDEIAYAAYGDVKMVNTLIEANPSIPITERLAAGTRLLVPIVENVAIDDTIDNLPPWKR